MDAPDPSAPGAPGTVARDYWDLVFDALSRRRTFRVALAVLALLYAAAIYAPLVANGRPYVLEAVDLGAYRQAARTLSAVATELERIALRSDEEHRARLEQAGTLGRAGVPQTRLAALRTERAALGARLAVLRRSLAAEDAAPLDALERQVDEALATFADGDGDGAAAALGAAKSRARELRSELAPADPARPDAGGVRLVSRRSYPLVESLAWDDVLWMVLCGCALTWPLWNRAVDRWWLRGDASAIRRARPWKAATPVVCAVLAALAWKATVDGGVERIDVPPYKAGIDAGDLVLVRAGHRHDEAAAFPSRPVWPPVPYSFSETHLEAGFRPPTWTRAAQVDEEGRYLYGARAEAQRRDTETRPDAPVLPIEVRAGERAYDDPLRRLAGTDALGRDFFTRMLWGGRASLAVGLLSAALAGLLGVTLGALGGYFGGWVDVLLLRTIEVLQSLPSLFLVLMAMAFTDPEVVPPMLAIVAVIACVQWTGVARLVRGEFLRLREQEFVLAARALGFGARRTILRHVLPNAMGPVLVWMAFAVASGLLIESAVSFLGFGARPPDASWGSLVNESSNPSLWWIQVFPGLLIFVTVTCYNLVGDAFRDALDPRLQR